ncbi:hypothetical protein EDB89DRAFT_1907246 [Lactarius sanguifluus]|nr:hypothetical protein EDB89DRAFT_1907246 [Lactarius sanguifluus]
MSFDGPIQYNIRDYRRTNSIFGLFDSERMQSPRRGALRPRVYVVVCRAGARVRSWCPPAETCYIFEITLQDECERASASRWRSARWPSVCFDAYDAGAQAHFFCSRVPNSSGLANSHSRLIQPGLGNYTSTQGTQSLQASWYTLAEGLCSGAGAKASSSVLGLRGALIERRTLGRWCALAKGLPVVSLGGRRVGWDMAQARSLGLVGNGRSQAEGCVLFPATSAPSLPWLFRGVLLSAFDHECTRFAGRGSNLSEFDDKTTPG